MSLEDSICFRLVPLEVLLNEVFSHAIYLSKSCVSHTNMQGNAIDMFSSVDFFQVQSASLISIHIGQGNACIELHTRL